MLQGKLVVVTGAGAGDQVARVEKFKQMTPAKIAPLAEP
jgi:hypothetical protein